MPSSPTGPIAEGPPPTGPSRSCSGTAENSSTRSSSISSWPSGTRGRSAISAFTRTRSRRSLNRQGNKRQDKQNHRRPADDPLATAERKIALLDGGMKRPHDHRQHHPNP